MAKKRFIIIILLFLIFNLSSSITAQSELAMSIRNHLIVITEYKGAFPKDEHVRFYQELMEFYDKRHHRSIWFNKNTSQEKVDALVQEIQNSYQHGLNPDDYHLKHINDCFKDQNLLEKNCVDKMALLDILLTDAYLSLASDYLNGKINAEIIVDDYDYQDDQLKAQKLLEFLLQKNNVSKTLNAQLPNSKNYHQLKDKLYLYRDSGKITAWPKIKAGETLAINSRGDRVKDLIDNLAARKYINKSLLDFKDKFNYQVQEAVVKFQKANGLKADAYVGAKTLEQLNISLEDRIKQIIINLERWRWLPEKLEKRYIYVNIANYKLKLYDDDKIIMEMKTIVGREQRSTPVFSDQINYLVLNPYWYVPKSIAVEDLLPKIKNDYKYLKENNFSLFEYTGNNKLEEVDPAAVNWLKVDEDNLNYLIRQNPGENNSLGRVKFMFPNKFSVYLHDTPGRYLFSQNQRSFSSGCIRIEKPVDLAEYLLKDQEKWDRETIVKEMTKDKEKIIYLKKPIKIYLQYNTAWVDSSGILNFREDIYNRDKKVIKEYFRK